MKQKIYYSVFNSGATVTTIILWVIYIAAIVLYLVFKEHPFDNVFFWVVIGAFVVFSLLTFFTIPFSVSSDNENIIIHKAFNTKKIKISDIRSVEPTEINQYKEIYIKPFKWTEQFTPYDEGRYYLYYGKPINPVKISLKEGRHYTIGTTNPDEFMEFINKKIK